MNRLLGTVLLTVAVSASMVLPAVADEAEVCPGLDSGAVSASGELVTVTVDAPVGEVITMYCVSSGAADPGDGAVLIAVDPGVVSLLISHPSGKGIVAWSVTFDLAPETAAQEPTEPSPVETTPEPASSAPSAAPAAVPSAGAAAPDVTGSSDGTPVGLVGPGSHSAAEAPAAQVMTTSAPPVQAPAARTASEAPVAEARARPFVPLAVADAPRADGALVPAGHVPPSRAATVRADGFAAEGHRAGLVSAGSPAELVAALLVLGLLGSAATAFHVARREPAEH